MKEFKVNEYITLKLEGEQTNIYVEGQLFSQCKFLLLNIPVEEISSFDEIQSIDEVAEKLDRSMEENQSGALEIPPEVEFWGHCSNLQVWAEMNYNTRLLHSNIAFPLLKRLTDEGDSNAKRVFKEEIFKKFLSGTEFTTRFLLNGGYHSFLSIDEITPEIKNFDFKETPDNTLINFILLLRYLAEDGLAVVKEQMKYIITRSFVNERFSIIRFILGSNILKEFKSYSKEASYPYLSEEEINELIEQLNFAKVVNLEYKLRFKILRGIVQLGSLKAKNLLKEEMRKSLLHGNFNIIHFLMKDFSLTYFTEEEVNRIYQEMDIQKITKSPSLGVFPILKQMGVKNPEIEGILKEEISKRFLQGDFATVHFLVSHYYFTKLSKAKREALIEELDFTKILEDTSPQMITLLESLAEKGFIKAKYVLEEELIRRLTEGDFVDLRSAFLSLYYLFPKERLIELLKDFNFNKITVKSSKESLPLLLKIAHLGSQEVINLLKKEVKKVILSGNEEEIVFLLNSVGNFLHINHYFYFFTDLELDNLFQHLDYDNLVERKFEKLQIPTAEKKFLVDLQNSLTKRSQILTLDYIVIRNRIVTLRLSNRSINHLPKSVCSLTALKELDLNFNNLKELPDELGELPLLVNLELMENKFEHVPESIGALNRLESLDLSFNQIKEIPKMLGNLRRLRTIRLCGNNITRIPVLFGSEVEKKYAKILKGIKLYPHKGYKNYRRLDKIRERELDLSGNDINDLHLPKESFIYETLDLSNTPYFYKNFTFHNYLVVSQLNELGVPSNDRWGFVNDQDLDYAIKDAVKLKFCIEKQYIKNDLQNDLGVSKFGGSPDVPRDFDWPYWASRPLSFVMQLNFEDLNRFKEYGFSVQKGMLYFFYDPYQEEWGANSLHKNAYRVIYLNEKASNLKRRANPSQNRRFTYPACLIKFHQDISLPYDPHYIFQDFSYKEINEIREDYHETYQYIFEDSLTRYISKNNLQSLGGRSLWTTRRHFLFGYPDEIQEMGFWKGWTQLLQLGTDSVMRWMWGDRGYIHIMIKEEDLKKNYYEDVRLIVDCY